MIGPAGFMRAPNTHEGKKSGPSACYAGSALNEAILGQLSKKKKRGCPTCDGVDAKSCMQCRGNTRMCDWFNTYSGWSHYTELTVAERNEADANFKA